MSDNNKASSSSSAPAPPTLSNTIGFINAFKSLLKKNNKNDKPNNTNSNKGINKINDTNNSGNNEGAVVGLSVLSSTRERRSSSEAPPPLQPSNRIERSHSDVPLPSITNVSSPSPSTNPALAYMALSPASRARTFKTYKFRPLPPIPSLDCLETNKDTLQKIDNLPVTNNNDNLNKENLINDNTLRITSTKDTPLSATLYEATSPLRHPSPAVDFEDDFSIISCPPISPLPSSPTNNHHHRKLSIITETLPPPPSHNARQNTPHHLNKIEIPSQMFINFYSIEERNHRMSSEDIGRSKESVEKMERKADGEVGDGEIDDFILIDDYNENGKNSDVI